MDIALSMDCKDDKSMDFMKIHGVYVKFDGFNPLKVRKIHGFCKNPWILDIFSGVNPWIHSIDKINKSVDFSANPWIFSECRGFNLWIG